VTAPAIVRLSPPSHHYRPGHRCGEEGGVSRAERRAGRDRGVAAAARDRRGRGAAAAAEAREKKPPPPEEPELAIVACCQAPPLLP
jgi:hypothetical protein